MAGKDKIIQELNDTLSEIYDSLTKKMFKMVKKQKRVLSTNWEQEVPICLFCGSDEINVPPKPKYAVTQKNAIREEIGVVSDKSRVCCDDYKERLEKMKKYMDEKAYVLKSKYKSKLVTKDIENNSDNANLGKRFGDRTFSNWIEPKGSNISEKAKKYCDSFGGMKGRKNGILMGGVPGNGKTHIAAAISNDLIDKGFSVKFVNVITLINNLKTLNFDEVEDYIMTLNDADLLVIDDLGKGNSSEYTKSVIYGIINSRYENYKPLIATTNLKSNDMSKYIDQAVVSRIYGMCMILPFNLPDYRENNKEFL